MLKYLVTGGTGFIGAALVKRLVQKGHPVRVLDNNLRGSKHRLHDVLHSIELIEGDIRNRNDVDRACQGMDGVFHLAYVNGTEFFYTKPDLVLEVAVKGMINILEASIEHQLLEFYLASSSEVYQTPSKIPTEESVPLVIPDPQNPRYSYGGGKIICELMALHWGASHFNKLLIFRPHNVYGPDMGFEHVIPQFIKRMQLLALQKSTPFPIEGSGKETRSFIYIDDFIDALILLKEKGQHKEIYHIGTNQEVSIEHIAELIGNYYQTSVICMPGPLKPGGTLRRCPDISKLKALGFKPQIQLATGIEATTQWYSRHANSK
jgi:nucleoside-diphosphate-sugar epimerase